MLVSDVINIEGRTTLHALENAVLKNALGPKLIEHLKVLIKSA